MKNNIFGKCTLVGAGPGDPELLTLKALKAIQAASVLFVDDLVNPEIVAFASPSARIVYVGKRGGCKSTPQAFIEKLMVMAVKEGDNVVRLKGGIFGGTQIKNVLGHGYRVIADLHRSTFICHRLERCSIGVVVASQDKMGQTG